MLVPDEVEGLAQYQIVTSHFPTLLQLLKSVSHFPRSLDAHLTEFPPGSDFGSKNSKQLHVLANRNMSSVLSVALLC